MQVRHRGLPGLENKKALGPHYQPAPRSYQNPCPRPQGGLALAMRTSSHLLAAVRKREAMLLESVYSRSFCWNRASYLKGKQDVMAGGVQVGTLLTCRGLLAAPKQACS